MTATTALLWSRRFVAPAGPDCVLSSSVVTLIVTPRGTRASSTACATASETAARTDSPAAAAGPLCGVTTTISAVRRATAAGPVDEAVEAVVGPAVVDGPRVVERVD